MAKLDFEVIEDLPLGGLTDDETMGELHSRTLWKMFQQARRHSSKYYKFVYAGRIFVTNSESLKRLLPNDVQFPNKQERKLERQQKAQNGN